MATILMRLLLSLVIVLGGLTSLADTAAGSARAVQTSQPPFGLGEVTTANLTPERFAAALPQTFDGMQQEYLGFLPVEDHLHGFSTSSEEFAYFGPGGETHVLAIINDLGAEPSVASAIEGVADSISSSSGFTIHEENTAAGAVVPFLLTDQDKDIFALVWGAQDGNWVFTLIAPTEPALEEFVGVVVDVLQSSSSAGSDGAEIDPEATVDRLLLSPFPESTLPAGFAGAEVSGGDERSDGEGISVDVSVELPRSTAQGIFYAIYSTPSEAQRAYDTHVNILDKDQGYVPHLINDGPFPIMTLLASETVYEYGGAASFCLILFGSVYVGGSSVGEDSIDVANANACLLAEAGAAHLESLGYTPELTQPKNDSGGLSSGGSDESEQPTGTSSTTAPDLLIDSLLNTPFPVSELPRGMHDMRPGVIGDGPDHLPNFAASEAVAWLHFLPDHDLSITINFGAITYAIFESEADAQRAWEALVQDLEQLEGTTVFPSDDPDRMMWNAEGPGFPAFIPGEVVKVGPVLVYVGLQVYGSPFGMTPEEALVLPSLMDAGVSHLSTSLLAIDPPGTNLGDATGVATQPGVTFDPLELSLEAGATTSFTAAMPDAEFLGGYELDVLIPAELELVGDPTCSSPDPETCESFYSDVVPQLDGSTLVQTGGYYDYLLPSASFTFDVRAASGVNSVSFPISARLIFYTHNGEWPSADTVLEVSFE